MAALSAWQVPVTFEDVAIYFSPEEWAELAEWQKELYQDVMEANFELVASLGSWPPKPELICKIEQGEEPCVVDAGQAPSSAEWGENAREPAIKEESDGDWQQPAHPDGIASGSHPLETGRPSWCEVQPAASRSVLQAATEGGGGPWEMGAALPPKDLLICSECGRCFEERQSLSKHQALHREEERGAFACRSCGKLFRYRLNLLTHKKHRGKRSHPCGQCGLELCLRGDLLHHRTSHSTEGAHSCGVCGLVFRHKAHLLAHEGAHEQARPQQCPTCSRAFGSEAELSAHQAVHREERPFVCSQCGESFSWKESLQFHQQVHAQEGGHPCPVCGKTFTRHGNLLTHQRVHTGELLFACPECERSFPNRANLMAHSRFHRRCLSPLRPQRPLPGEASPARGLPQR